ncbi:hypothetical protein QE441_003688 [Chryseobacterium sp. SORGH_AS909]|uniref:hypothetical protein n=1 Tax=Chryseobacterium sp. SORGH_AS_0909 TaxID=3041759 RepID=UPI002864913F|nr:hypothetical protein [Chryseobacterium sp. SORGH_AS_0909]MDR6087894.1 hypothetical protein [Chryseobacterium sp. SORGH_AS_0909]
MKRLCKIFVFFLLLLVSSGAFAQKYYDEQWKKIEGNIGKGTFKSNLPIVLDIQNQAMKDNNVLQLIRSLKAEFSIINETEDQENNNAVSTFFAKIQTAGKQLKGKEKLLYDTLANEFFMNYYNRNSWRINGRTNLDTRDFSQIETWSSLAFKNYLLKNFAALDAQRQEMRQISLATYKDLFPEKADLVYFPTLSDWYEIQEIEFLSNSNLFYKERDYGKPEEDQWFV